MPARRAAGMPRRETTRSHASTSHGKWSTWKKVIAPASSGKRPGTNFEKHGNRVACKKTSAVLGQNSKRSGIYELRVTKGSKHKVVYVGKAERNGNALGGRIREYCRDGSHKKKEINQAVKKGFSVDVRVQPTARSKAQAAENAQLKKYNYAWNEAKNGDTRKVL